MEIPGMFRRALFALFGVLLCASAAVADSNPANIPRIDNVAQFRANSSGWGQYQSFQLANYASNGDGGAGYFVKGAPGCTDDGGVVLKDGANNCYYRQFSGAVHL